MSGELRPLLALDTPEVGSRRPQSPAVPPRVSRPGAARQGQRLSPQFAALNDAFEARRAELSGSDMREVDPELVLVFDLAGSVEDFRNAIDRVDGLDFLAEYLDEVSEPDEDFHLFDRQSGRLDDAVQHSLYLVMSNAEAAHQLVRLFERWQADPGQTFDYGLAKFRAAFDQLRAIRWWGPEDRVRETGLLEDWREHLELVGQSHSPVRVEIELWYRHSEAQRTAAQARLDEAVAAAGGQVHARAQIAAIAYHAVLVELPLQQVEAVVEQGARAIRLLATDEIMFVSPYTQMSVVAPQTEPPSSPRPPAPGRAEGLPRIALLDGLPVVNHDALINRLVVDDPDEIGRDYPVAARHHGTAMASLIIHGDLSAAGDPLDRPLYVRPIMEPHPQLPGREQVSEDRLFPDLLHRVVRRMVEGDGHRPASAPSVRIVNVSIGSEARALVRRMSPSGRLLDWLALEFNLLFIVSAGNHSRPLAIPADTAGSLDDARRRARIASRNASRLRGILPPGDAINVVTVGATHDDAAGEIVVSDTVWDLTDEGAPALYGGVGPGVRRSVKPDLHHSGGRGYYRRPAASNRAATVPLELAGAGAAGPGMQVATPGRGGALNSTGYTYGTSNATALVSRAASSVFDVLEAGADTDDPQFADALYHPVLVRALLVHASSWEHHGEQLKEVLDLDPRRARRELTALLGYGLLDPSRLARASTNRATLIAGGSIGRDQRHTYSIPMPASLQARAAWHRVTATLAYMAPTTGELMRYRAAKIFFDTPDETITAGRRRDADHHAVRRGSCQHEIIEGSQAMVFGDGDSLPLHVECMRDARTLRAGESVRYGLVVSVETAVQTSTTIHEEVRARLRARARDRARTQVTG